MLLLLSEGLLEADRDDLVAHRVLELDAHGRRRGTPLELLSQWLRSLFVAYARPVAGDEEADIDFC